MNNYKHCSCNSKPCRCPKDPKHCKCHCSCEPKPPKKLTTGLFRVPVLSNANNAIDLLIIGINNLTQKQKSVIVTVDRCPEAVFPATSQETTTIRRRIILNQFDCTQIHIASGPSFVPGDLLRVTFEGDIVKEAVLVEATVVGRDTAGEHEPTMFFRHDDLISIFP